MTPALIAEVLKQLINELPLILAYLATGRMLHGIAMVRLKRPGAISALTCEAMFTPGNTKVDCVSIRIGDRVRVPGDMTGTVVAVIDDGEFSAEYPLAAWAYLNAGILVMTKEAGLVHFPDAGVVKQISR